MSKAIAHRGPDDEGFFISRSKKVGLVNRRLAIIDLTKRGHQPMSYKRRYVITYNGEIYNFQSEREKLKKMGYRFHSGTDTEVILALYDQYGTGCLSHLRGMFAFAIYDQKEKVVFFARDRIGKKPLKFYFENDVLIFASELKAILTQKEVKREPDYLAIHHYLTYGYVPSPQTGFVGIEKLAPGTYMILDLKCKKLIKKRYWQPDFSEKLGLSESEWCRRILEELEEATKLRMIADVPIGAFLSGGVDSSGVVATMARLSKKPVKTFSIVFKEKRYDESIHADRIAKKYSTDHHKLQVKQTSLELLPNLVRHFEEPFSDSSSIVTYMVSQLARRYVTVILNGDGGDENFAGYDRHVRLARDVFLDKNLSFLKTISPLFKIVSRKTYKFLEKSKTPLSHRYMSYNSWLKNYDKDKIYTKLFGNLHGNKNSYDYAEEIFANCHSDDKKNQGLYFDLTSYLPEDLLVKVDIASMANSLEGRSPLLDHHMVDLACKIPYKLKVRGKEKKYILKKAFEKIVPKENLYRPKKGFSVPLDEWFSGKLNKYARSKLLAKKAKTRKIFRQNEIRRYLDTHSVEHDFGPQLWTLLTLELWMDSYFG